MLPLTAMPYIVIGAERFALPIGDTPVGGTGDGTLCIPQLARVPFAAVISVMSDGTATLRRTGSHHVRLDGAEIGDEPRALAHGTRVSIANIELTFGDIRENGSTASIQGVESIDPYAALGGSGLTAPTADSGGRLVWADGRIVLIPAQGLIIGREPTAGMVVTGKGVSRYHAMVAPTLRGYIVRDQSENGLFINGQRVDGEQLLGQGDVLSIGEHRLRFEADSAEMDAPARSIASAQTTGSLAQGPRAPLSAPIARAQLLATLEVMTNGPLKGTLFRIERAVAHVGRAEHNEVRLRDTSVSGSHATLTRRSEGWVLLDLGSTNGTYVDGERVSGERRLSGATELRFGDMKLVFRPIAGSAPEDDSTRAVVGVRNRPA